MFARLVTSLCLLLLVFLVGCGTTPTARWAQARETLTAAQDTVLSLHENGVIDDKLFLKMNTLDKSARNALKVAETQLPAGGQTFEDWMSVTTAAIKQIAWLQADKLGPQPSPAH